jgi:hypothetical protein
MTAARQDKRSNDMNDDWSFEKHVADIESVEAIARAEAAEAEVAKWREMHADRAHDLQHEFTRANDAEADVMRLRVDVEAAEGFISQLTDWIIEADAAFNVDKKPAQTLDDCLGLVRMCHEGAAALAEVERLRAALAEIASGGCVDPARTAAEALGR